jgi:hypothetical protein
MRQKLVVAIARQESGLSNQSLKSFQAETADIDLAFAVDDLLRKRLSIAAECLNPWPEQGDAMMTRSLSG